MILYFLKPMWLQVTIEFLKHPALNGSIGVQRPPYAQLLKMLLNRLICLILIRKTIVTLGQKLCQTPEEFKSWSQNLGHEDVLTTLYSYGHVQQHRQGEIFQQLKLPRSSGNQNVDDIARAVLKAMADQNAQIGV